MSATTLSLTSTLNHRYQPTIQRTIWFRILKLIDLNTMNGAYFSEKFLIEFKRN
ncbi:unnamed protein product, partial [Nesidiocoris tenuis]